MKPASEQSLKAFILGFTGLDMAVFLAVGLTVFVVVGLHKPEEA